ncbi:GatB/YqeY domain-containing protein [soil metagenome]
MSLKEKISADLKEAMKARDQVRVDTLRSVLSAFSYKKLEEKSTANQSEDSASAVAKSELTAEEELAVMQKQVKQRNDSIAEFTKGNRPELASKEVIERDILATYLPAQKSEAEVRELVKTIIDTLPAEGRNQGGAMKVVMPQLKGLADGNLVRQIVTELLK